MLEDILEYHQVPEDGTFVTQVMKRVQRQQRTRRLILASTGVIGALFGAAGAIMLTDPLAQLMSGIKPLPLSVALFAGIAFLAWLFQDETEASG